MTIESKIESYRKQLGDEKPPTIPDIETVQAAVCAAFKISLRGFLSKSQETRYAWPRFVSYFFCYQIPNMSLVRIAKAHRRKSYATVYCGIQRVEDLKTDRFFKWAFERAERLLTQPRK